MRYKVGDRVRVRKDLVYGKKYRKINCLQGHMKECGKTFTVVLADGYNYRLNDSLGYWWSEEMLEEVEEMNIDIESDGKIVTAQMGDKYGVAKCSPENEFDIFVGARLAIDRLEEECKSYGWLKKDVTYYFPRVDTNKLYDYYQYDDDAIDKRFISRSIVFKTKEEAISCAKKMLKVVK